jgi:hypothetical protein
LSKQHAGSQKICYLFVFPEVSIPVPEPGRDPEGDKNGKEGTIVYEMVTVESKATDQPFFLNLGDDPNPGKPGECRFVA